MSSDSLVSNTPEDETFRKLRQAPFEQAQQVWNETLSSGQSMIDVVYELECIGWTQDEYYRAYTAHKYRAPGRRDIP